MKLKVNDLIDNFILPNLISESFKFALIMNYEYTEMLVNNKSETLKKFKVASLVVAFPKRGRHLLISLCLVQFMFSKFFHVKSPTKAFIIYYSCE